MDTAGIQNVVENSLLIQPREEKIRRTADGSQETFGMILEKSKKDPEKFWEEVAEQLFWYQRWEETISGDLPDFSF